MNENKITVHPLTENPTKAWKELVKTQKYFQIKTPNLPEIYPNKVRIVCMSDTHSFTSSIKFCIPDGDIFIHAGDFTRCGAEQEVDEFNTWLGRLPHKYKIVIAGNHELSFDEKFTKLTSPSSFKSIPTLGHTRNELHEAVGAKNIREKLKNCIYLEDSGIELFGLKIYGSPWQPEFHKWAFNLSRGEEILQKWNLIPENVDVLITHTPPVGHGDACCTGVRAGCVELLTTVQNRVKPKYHVFGHIHEGYGITTDGTIIYVNASTCNINYNPVNPPIVFDISLPPGCVKESSN